MLDNINMAFLINIYHLIITHDYNSKGILCLN